MSAFFGAFAVVGAVRRSTHVLTVGDYAAFPGTARGFSSANGFGSLSPVVDARGRTFDQLLVNSPQRNLILSWQDAAAVAEGDLVRLVITPALPNSGKTVWLPSEGAWFASGKSWTWTNVADLMTIGATYNVTIEVR